jgi:hypothetical protein
LFLFFLGKLHGVTLTEMHRVLRTEFGDIVKFKGMFGKLDIVMLYKPEDFETLFRTETIWPVRNGMDAFVYYRKEHRPDVFKGIGGLVSEYKCVKYVNFLVCTKFYIISTDKARIGMIFEQW